MSSYMSIRSPDPSIGGPTQATGSKSAIRAHSSREARFLGFDIRTNDPVGRGCTEKLPDANRRVGKSSFSVTISASLRTIVNNV